MFSRTRGYLVVDFLAQAIEEFMSKQRQRNALIKDLNAKFAQGGVKGDEDGLYEQRAVS